MPATRSTLASLFPSLAMARLVLFFILRSGQRFHLRELMRLTGLPSASVQAELRRLTDMGVLTRVREGRLAVYAADEAHPAWRAWMLLVRSCARPSDVLREALNGAAGLEQAFVFGSTVTGNADARSDLDVFLVAGAEARCGAERLIAAAGLLIDRELDVIGYDREELGERIRSGNPFIQRVLAGPKEWILGDAATLPETAPA